MTLVFLALLAIAWMAIFLPAALRAHESAPLSSAERFKRRMELIAPRARRGRYVVVPESTEQLQRGSFRRSQHRRRQNFVFLLCAAGFSGLLAIVIGGSMWDVHLLLDLSLSLYVALLLGAKSQRSDSAARVRRLRPVARPEDSLFHEPLEARAGRR